MVEWLDQAIFYEIYPQSFQDSNADGIGDFNGIKRRLDHIQALGCNAIWMNPCFASPFSDAGYDVADYYKAAPRYGSNEELRELFEEIHNRNMHIILDLVPGHTSVEHPWFKESMKAEKNAYTDRYIWTDDIWKGFDGVNNIAGCIRGISDRDGSCAVNFFSTQPALNYGFAHPTESWQFGPDSEEATASRIAMQDIMAFWLDMGCDGFRVDMAGSMVKGDESGEATIAFWQKVRTFMEERYPDAAMISEWGEPDKSLKGGFHMDFLLHFGPSHYMDLFRVDEPFFSKRGKGDCKEFVDTYKKNYQATNGKGLICIPSGNHDMPRMRHWLDEEEMKIAFAFLLSMPGAPFIYYGDEIGMQYVENLQSVEGGFSRTGARTPMQWGDGVNDGFSTASPDKLYIPMDTNEQRPTVKKQEEDPDSLLHHVQALTKIRLENEALQSNATIAFEYVEDHAYPLVYRRDGKTQQVLVAINPSGQEVTCKIETKEAKQVLYHYGDKASLKAGMLTVPATSVTFFTI
ncbi:alpha-amylase family glycosyl hydrolase [Anaerosporobacter faecicola]|uniref:alpha-amylase family glycosyl hydrolase n=1 Tax=Anaerosporobacter faecicola TaxID=2718714 RepID=UPI00143C56A3|nr:alpha-amylase family glycosyl hydrolase [Anaerosporobacter faecicola]